MLLMLLGVSLPAKADQAGCVAFAGIAADVMVARQNGASADQVRAHYLQLYGDRREALEAIDRMITAAFQTVRAPTMVERQDFVDAMRNGSYEWCMAGM